jgi:hypothetical protein
MTVGLNRVAPTFGRFVPRHFSPLPRPIVGVRSTRGFVVSKLAATEKHTPFPRCLLFSGCPFLTRSRRLRLGVKRVSPEILALRLFSLFLRKGLESALRVCSDDHVRRSGGRMFFGNLKIVVKNDRRARAHALGGWGRVLRAPRRESTEGYAPRLVILMEPRRRKDLVCQWDGLPRREILRVASLPSE